MITRKMNIGRWCTLEQRARERKKNGHYHPNGVITVPSSVLDASRRFPNAHKTKLRKKLTSAGRANGLASACTQHTQKWYGKVEIIKTYRKYPHKNVTKMINIPVFRLFCHGFLLARAEKVFYPSDWPSLLSWSSPARVRSSVLNIPNVAILTFSRIYDNLLSWATKVHRKRISWPERRRRSAASTALSAQPKKQRANRRPCAIRARSAQKCPYKRFAFGTRHNLKAIENGDWQRMSGRIFVSQKSEHLNFMVHTLFWSAVFLLHTAVCMDFVLGFFAVPLVVRLTT